VKLMSLEGLDDNWKLKGAYFYELHSIGKERGTALGGSRYPCSFVPPPDVPENLSPISM
jgi:hypothetical protein